MWWHPLFLTLKLMAVSALMAGMVGIPAAWAVSSLEGGGRAGRWVARLFLGSMVAALAMPMILHAASWEATAGKFGWLPLTQTGSRSSALGAFGAFGGLAAAGWIHGLIGVALVALATWYGVRRVPASVIEQSSMDAGPIVVWWKVRLPMAMPWLAAALLATATLAATEMTVVDLYGYLTTADVFYRFHSTTASTNEILMTLFLPLLMATIVLCLLPIWRRRMATVGVKASDDVAQGEPLSAAWQALAFVIALSVSAIVIVIPVAGLVIKAGHLVMVEDGVRSTSWSLAQFVETLAWAPVTFAREYSWTAIIAILTGISAVLVAWVAASLGRTHRRLAGLLDATSLVWVLIPGPIVGMAVVHVFQWDLPGFRVAYQRTLIPTVLALLVRAGPVAYWILRSGYRGIDDAVFDAARLDRSWLARLWAVDRRLLGRSLVAAFLGSAIVASGDVPALLPVIPPSVTTVGTRLFELLHNGARYQEAALALWYVGAVLLIVSVWLRWGRLRPARLDE